MIPRSTPQTPRRCETDSSCAGCADDSVVVGKPCARTRPVNRPAHTGRATARRALLPLLLVAGCTDVKFLHRHCPTPTDAKTAADTPSPDAAYRVGCADVLEVAFADRPEWDAIASVGVDGRLPLETPASPRVEGLTLAEVRDVLARDAAMSPERVHVWLASARCSQVYLHGPIRGRIRAVPYQGPESAIDFLKRVGGLPPGSKLNQVYVVRPNVATGRRPEVFQVDVPAVLLDGDDATNVLLRPSDEVYIGETRGSSISRLMPAWLGPAYRRVVGLLPDDWWPFNRPRSPGG